MGSFTALARAGLFLVALVLSLGVAPRQATGHVRVLVRVTEHLREGRSLPGLEVEAGFREEDGAPGPAVARGFTGPEGECILRLVPGSDPDGAQGSQGMWGRVIEPGWTQRRTSIRGGPGLRVDGLPVLHLRTFPGTTVRGTLLGRDGRPTSGRVDARPERENGVRRSGESGTQGRFTVHLEEPGPYVFLARGEAMGQGGTARSPVVEVDLLDPPQDLRLQLEGSGVLTGQVVDASGRPRSGLRLIARSAAVGTGGPLSHVELQRLAGRGTGHHRLETVTDGGGAFRFEGLSQEPFLVRADGRGHLLGEWLTPEAVSPNGEELLLTLDDPHLVVSARDAQGRDVPLGEPARLDRSTPFVSRWPEVPTVVKIEAPRVHGLPEAESPVARGTLLGGGEVIFDGDPGRASVLVLYAKDRIPTVHPVPEDLESGRNEVVLELGPKVGRGTLVVTTTSSAGDELSRGLAFRLRDPGTGAVLFEQRGSGWLAAPAGDYLLEVTQVYEFGWHGEVFNRPTLGSFTTEVRVLPDERTRVEAVLGPPARIEVTVRGQGREEDRRALGAHLTLEALGEETLRWFSQPLLFLRGSDGRVCVVQRVKDDGRRTPRWPWNEPFTSDALTPGRYVLEVYVPGGRRVSREVELEADRVLTLEVDLGT